MLSVIIPTVQKKLKVLRKQLASLERDNAVTEVIVINNKPECPLDLSEFSKVKLYTPEKNLYVNPSWNLGVTMAKNNAFCLMNDDVIFPDGYCSAVINEPLFNAEDTGVIGMWPNSIQNHPEEDDLEPPVVDGELAIAYVQMGDRVLYTNDWGISIFGRKENYYEIPERYQIIYGDNWLLYKNVKAEKKNYYIYNCICNHIHGASSASEEFTQRVIADIVAANSSEEFKKPE